MATEYVQYPKYKYHRTDPAKVVASADEEAALEGEWFESPADIPEDKPKGKK